MWQCPKCRSKVDDSFDVCWSCGTSVDGIEDPDFVVADLADPIPDEESPKEMTFDDPLADFAGTPLPDLVEIYMAENTVEAKFIADQLMELGIPAVADGAMSTSRSADCDPRCGAMDQKSTCDKTIFKKP